MSIDERLQAAGTEIPPLPAVRGVDEDGAVVDIVAPTTAQEAIDYRARARAVAGTLTDYARWLDGESVRLMLSEDATAIIDPDGRMYSLGEDNDYSPVLDPKKLREELLAVAGSAAAAGGARLARMVEEAFVYSDPPKPAAAWRVTTNLKLNAIEALGTTFGPDLDVAAIVRRHRAVTKKRVLRERK